jgi:NIPSNAP
MQGVAVIIELQSFTLKSRSPATVETCFKNALPERTTLSPLGGCWRSEVGVLNQMIVAWPYEDEDERARVGANVSMLKNWPPTIDEFVIEQSTRIVTLAPFSPPLTPRRLGNLYEIRIYQYPPGAIPEVIDAWSTIIDERVKHSPLVAAGYADAGAFHEWVHIWAYRDAGERERIREETTRLGIWPISIVDRQLGRAPRAVSLRMQNMLVVPMEFSPLR